ncbi:MAG: glycosyltransferase family 2 protein [Lachnospiraceae bacterium]|nr:glycosyltransferase family 2 protein [Lachnospiraceae bacterium]
MTLEVLVAAVEQNVNELIHSMRIESDAVIVNQCNDNYTKMLDDGIKHVLEIGMKARGVGISRNTAILNSRADILLFSDQDIVYEQGYATAIEKEFAMHPEADMILFNIQVGEERKTYENLKWKRVHWYNCGRYGAVSFAIRREKLLESRVMFSQLFGGGAKYSAGEDSLFLKDLMDRGIRVYASPILIGREEEGDSTWFKGYDEKFFFDRGVLYKQLYGIMAKPWSVRFLLAHKNKICTKYTVKDAYRIMKKGIKNRSTINQ